MEDIKQKFYDKKQELKDWLYGTVYKGYDQEEEAEAVQQDVDDFFTEKFIDELLALAVAQERERITNIIENQVGDALIRAQHGGTGKEELKILSSSINNN